MRKTTVATLRHVWVVFHTNPYKFWIFKISLNLFLTHLRAQITCYELKGDLSSVMLKEIFQDSFENFNIYWRICVENHAVVAGWQKVVFVIQILRTFGGHCSRYFWDALLKILRLCNFNMLFQLVLTKFYKSELFSCLLKVDHTINSCKGPIDTCALYHH